MAYHEEGNLFSTTILVLVSALQKLCQVEKVAPGTRLFRGLGDKEPSTSRTSWGAKASLSGAS